MSVQPLTGVRTVSEAADHAKVSAHTIRREIARGLLEARYIGRCVRIRDDDLEAWIQKQTARVRSTK